MKGIYIECIYKTPKGIATTFTTGMTSAKEAIEIYKDLQKSGRVKQIQLIDHDGMNWSIKELEKYIAVVKEEPHHIQVYFDGGYDLEKRIAGLGCVIYYEQNERKYRIRKNACVEGLTSNNEAEYAALHLAVKELERLNIHRSPVAFLGDSLVVIKQLNGEWSCYEEELSLWMDHIEDDLKRFKITPTYENIPRKNNKEADHLATQALHNINIMSTKELE